MLSPISFERRKLVSFLSVNVGHETCYMIYRLRSLCRLLSDDDSFQLLQELCLLRNLILCVIFGLIFILVYLLGIQGCFCNLVVYEISTAFIVDLVKPLEFFSIWAMMFFVHLNVLKCGVFVGCKGKLNKIIQKLVQTSLFF